MNYCKNYVLKGGRAFTHNEYFEVHWGDVRMLDFQSISPLNLHFAASRVRKSSGRYLHVIESLEAKRIYHIRIFGFM